MLGSVDGTTGSLNENVQSCDLVSHKGVHVAMQYNPVTHKITSPYKERHSLYGICYGDGFVNIQIQATAESFNFWYNKRKAVVQCAQPIS
jgi:hypothetical protein